MTSRGRQRTTELSSNAVGDSDLISGGKTVNDVSKIPAALARLDESRSTADKTQFQTQAIEAHCMNNLPGGRL